jgi:hypothetical protein
MLHVKQHGTCNPAQALRVAMRIGALDSGVTHRLHQQMGGTTMRDNQDSDNELRSADRSWWRRWVVISVVLALAIVLLGMAWIKFNMTYRPFLRLGLSPEIEEQLIAAVPLIVAIGLAFALRAVVGRAPGTRNETAVRKTADSHYARMRWGYFIAVPVMALPLFYSPGFSWEPDTFAFYVLVVGMAAQALFVLRGFGWSKSFRRGLDDELTQALRAKAAKFGFGLAVAILILASIYTRYRPVPVDHLLLRMLFVTAVAPGLCFFFLEWQSGRNG